MMRRKARCEEVSRVLLESHLLRFPVSTEDERLEIGHSVIFLVLHESWYPVIGAPR